MQKQSRRKPRVIDATRMAYTAFGRGVVKGNPKRCIKCHQLIKRGEAWIKHASAVDPKYGRYSVIRHANCEGGKD